jgi:hypothetical protein
MKMMIPFLRVLAGCILLVLVFSALPAQEILRPLRTDTPPIIDGRLDEAVWQQAPVVGGFTTYNPDYGKAMSERTEVRMAYDNENLYFAFRCFDSEPDKVKSVVTSRDNNRADDWVCINLDSFFDQQSLSCFYVNALGIQSDSRAIGQNEDLSADFVWYSAGRIDEKGYVIEICIPLKSLRYSDANPVSMGVVFERRISRKSEHGTYPGLKPERGMSFQTQTIPMVYENLKHYTLFELLPSVTYTHKSRQDQGSLVIDERKADASLTTKYGLTSDLILDGTYNPDFSQIEADAGQVDVNLRYDLFYPEKRPFFLEGAENFRVGATGVSELDPIFSIVHTRTIINPLLGMKLTGKLSEKNTLASIYALDRISDDQKSLMGRYAHFPILRYKRTLDEDSYVGGIYAGVELKDTYNRLGGIDGAWRVNESATLEYHGLLSQTKDAGSAPENAGRSLALRYFHNTRDVDYDVSAVDISDKFAANMGFVARAGVLQLAALAKPKIYPESGLFRRVDVELFSGQTEDRPSGLWETSNHISILGVLPGNLSVRTQYTYSTEVFLAQRFRTGGFLITGGGQMAKQLTISLAYRRLKAIYYDPSAPYQGNNNRVSAVIIYQPSEQFEAYGTLSYSGFYRESDSKEIYTYLISRLKLTYQWNKYLFFRGIGEYNDYRKRLLTDFLASFTYIPGTVIHLGYGSLYEKTRWSNGRYTDSDRFLETQRGFFFKMSYLWRM